MGIHTKLTADHCSASWITAPNLDQHGYGVYHFRRNFQLLEQPSEFWVQVTADNRYQLYINGTIMCSGPARGEITNWYYETLDLAPLLKKGANTIAALVWNMGPRIPLAQISLHTGFLLQGNSRKEQLVNTNFTWKVCKSLAYKPCGENIREMLGVYIVVGPGDELDASKYIWGWEKILFNDEDWESAQEINHPQPVVSSNTNGYQLVPRNIPLLIQQRLRFDTTKRSTIHISHQAFLKGKKPLIIPKSSDVRILFDHHHLTVGYPELIISGGKNGKIYLSYAEALFDKDGMKGNRNDIKDKELYGNYDIFLPDGGAKRKFRPLWLRAYRFLQLDIMNDAEELLIQDIYTVETRYPLKLLAKFSSSDPVLKKIWQVSFRTAKLCAGEGYYDTPYYEQLQYAGDSRIQALISLYVAGDDRLMKKAIIDIGQSSVSSGLTQSRYPSHRKQVIPAFSLFWISMIHDYWMHRQDDKFVVQFLPVIKNILEWFETMIDTNIHMLGPLPYWNFVDWDNFDGAGIAPGSMDGNSSIVTLQYVYTLNQSSELFSAFGSVSLSAKYRKLANKLKKYTYHHCINRNRNLIADTPEKLTYSQHAGIWAILSDTIGKKKMMTFAKHLVEDKSISQVSLFYRFYLVQALKKAGIGDLYYGQLTIWKDMLELGLTTFPEKAEPTRSDCHAWSASPSYDFLATICGITPAASGFAKVLIKPAMGELKYVKASMPHHLGTIEVSFKKGYKNSLSAYIVLPEGLNGIFQWKDSKIELVSGAQKIFME